MTDQYITLSNQVQLKPYVQRQFKQIELMTDAELSNGAGGTMIVDLESYPNFFLIAFKDYKTKKYLKFEINDITGECFNERKLSWILHSYRTVGFNSIKFDLPIIWLSYYFQNCENLKEACNRIILQNYRPRDLTQHYGYIIPPIKHVDLIEVAPLKGSLKLYMARLHAQRIQDLPFEIETPLTENQIEIVTDYCFNDLDGTELLFDFMKERRELREAMSMEYGIDLNSKSDAQIAEAILNKEVSAITGSWPKRPMHIQPGLQFKYNPPPYLQYQTEPLQKLLEKVKATTFVVGDNGKVQLPAELKEVGVNVGNGYYRLGIGGLHSSEEVVSYKADDEVSIVDRDVTSYYPYLVMTLGLCPSSMGNAFLTVYDRIIQSRIRAKEAKRTTEANGKKIVVNGAGGKFSDTFSTLYGPDLTIQMTVTGQLDLLMFVEMLEICGLTVISANTDGIVTLVKKDQEAKYLECAKYWEYITGFNTEETRYSSYWARDVNSYFAVKLGAKSIKDIKVKGPYSEVGSQSGTVLDTNPTSQICTDAVKHLLLAGTPIEQTIKECKDFTRFITVRQAKAPGAHKDYQYLGKVVRWYFAKNEFGTINTVSHDSKVAESEGGKPVMDLPPSFPDDINYDWYINRTKEILYEIAYLQRPKQIKFF